MSNYKTLQFERSLLKAIEKVEKILASTINPLTPTLPIDKPHTYTDKFSLAEYITNLGLASSYNVLSELGVTDELYKKLYERVNNGEKKETVTLRFTCSKSYVFLKSETKILEPNTSRETVVEQSRGLFSAAPTTTTIKD